MQLLRAQNHPISPRFYMKIPTRLSWEVTSWTPGWRTNQADDHGRKWQLRSILCLQGQESVQGTVLHDQVGDFILLTTAANDGRCGVVDLPPGSALNLFPRLRKTVPTLSTHHRPWCKCVLDRATISSKVTTRPRRTRKCFLRTRRRFRTRPLAPPTVAPWAAPALSTKIAAAQFMSSAQSSALMTAVFLSTNAALYH
jgi:hypothetical protein